MSSEYSVAAHWAGPFDETGLQQWAEELRLQMRGVQSTLGLVFMTPKLFPNAHQILEILRVHARVPLLAGCSSQGLILADKEIEENAGLTLALFAVPEADLQAVHFTQAQVEEANGPGYWRLETGIELEQSNGWLAFIDPFHIDSEAWLRKWNEAYAPLPCSAAWPAAI